MTLFHSHPAAPPEAARPDYYFLEQVASTVSPARGAHMLAVAAALKDRPVAVLSGGLDARAESNFALYRDKGHFFAPGTRHQNFFAELHGHQATTKAELTALPLAGYLGGLTPYEDYARSATVYNDEAAQPVFRVARDEAGAVTAISYFVAGQPVRTDTYDLQHRLLASEQFGAVANSAQLNADAPTIHGPMSRTVYDEAGRPVFAQTFSPAQLWLLNAQAVPTRLFATEAGLMAWWLMTHLDGHNRIYINASDLIFRQLAGYPDLRAHLVPIVQDPLTPAKLAGTPFPELLVNQELVGADYAAVAATVTEMPNWRGFQKGQGWSVFKRH